MVYLPLQVRQGKTALASNTWALLQCVWYCSLLTGRSHICLICSNKDRLHFAHCSTPALCPTHQGTQSLLKEWRQEACTPGGLRVALLPQANQHPACWGLLHLDAPLCFHPVLTNIWFSRASSKLFQFEGDLRIFCACLRKDPWGNPFVTGNF